MSSASWASVTFSRPQDKISSQRRFSPGVEARGITCNGFSSSNSSFLFNNLSAEITPDARLRNVKVERQGMPGSDVDLSSYEFSWAIAELTAEKPDEGHPTYGDTDYYFKDASLHILVPKDIRKDLRSKKRPFDVWMSLSDTGLVDLKCH